MSIDRMAIDQMAFDHWALINWQITKPMERGEGLRVCGGEGMQYLGGGERMRRKDEILFGENKQNQNIF